MAFRLPEQFSRFFSVGRSMAGGTAARRLLQPGLPPRGNGAGYIRNGTMTVLANHPGTVHNIPQALSVGAGMTLIAITGLVLMLIVYNI